MAASKAKKSSTKKSSGDSKALYEQQLGKNTIHVDSTTAVYLPEGSALIGHFADVVSGEYQGKYGVVEKATAFDSKGWPTKVAFRTRDAANELLTVDYSDLRVSEAGKR